MRSRSVRFALRRATRSARMGVQVDRVCELAAVSQSCPTLVTFDAGKGTPSRYVRNESVAPGSTRWTSRLRADESSPSSASGARRARWPGGRCERPARRSTPSCTASTTKRATRARRAKGERIEPAERGERRGGLGERGWTRSGLCGSGERLVSIFGAKRAQSAEADEREQAESATWRSSKSRRHELRFVEALQQYTERLRLDLALSREPGAGT